MAMADAHERRTVACGRENEDVTWKETWEEPRTRCEAEGRTVARRETTKENPGGRTDEDES